MSNSSEGEGEGAVGNNNGETSTYQCQACGKGFTSVQALGGHQNAHRRERFALKRRQIEMKRHLARQSHSPQLLLPRGFPIPPPAAPCVLNSMMPPPAAAAVAGLTNVADFGADIIDGLDLDLTLKF